MNNDGKNGTDERNDGKVDKKNTSFELKIMMYDRGGKKIATFDGTMGAPGRKKIPILMKKNVAIDDDDSISCADTELDLSSTISSIRTTGDIGTARRRRKKLGVDRIKSSDDLIYLANAPRRRLRRSFSFEEHITLKGKKLASKIEKNRKNLIRKEEMELMLSDALDVSLYTVKEKYDTNLTPITKVADDDKKKKTSYSRGHFLKRTLQDAKNRKSRAR